MSNVRLGIVGYGLMGAQHAAHLLAGRIPHAKLAGVVARSTREAARDALPTEIPIFSSLEELLQAGGCDALLICTPHPQHPQQGILALQHGLHVLMEKPLSSDLASAQRLCHQARQSGRLLGVMFQQRTFPIHRRIQELMQSQAIGPLRRVDYQITDWLRTQAYYQSQAWRGTWQGEGGGILLNQCPHNLDLWQWFCGMPRRIRAFCRFGQSHRVEVEDEVTAYVEYDNGARGTFIASTGEFPGRNRLEIVGDSGRVTLEKGELEVVKTAVGLEEFIGSAPGGFDVPSFTREKFPAETGGGHAALTADFVAAIRTGSPLLAPAQEALASLELANAMLLSTWMDDWVELPLDGEAYREAFARYARK